MQFLHYKELWGKILIFIMKTSWVDNFKKLNFLEYQFPKLEIIAQNHKKNQIPFYTNDLPKRFPFPNIFFFLFTITFNNIFHQRQIYNQRQFLPSYWGELTAWKSIIKREVNKISLFLLCIMKRKCIIEVWVA